MITIMARPKNDKNHIITENFESEILAEQYIKLLKKNGWEVL